MTQKVDVSSVRRTTSGIAIAGPARLRQLMVKSAGSGTPRIKLTDGDGGENILDITFTTDDVHSVNIPGNGIRFENDVYVQNKANISAMAFFRS